MKLIQKYNTPFLFLDKKNKIKSKPKNHRYPHKLSFQREIHPHPPRCRRLLSRGEGEGGNEQRNARLSAKVLRFRHAGIRVQQYRPSQRLRS